MPEAARLVADWQKALADWRVWTFLGCQDIRFRFQRSFFGPLWLLIYTGFFVVGAGVFFGLMFAQPVEVAVPFLTAGVVLWAFLVATCVDGANAFVNAEGYIKQFCYPKQIYLLRCLVTQALVLAAGLAILPPIQLWFGKFQPLGWILSVPGLVLVLLTALAHITIFAYLGTRFRDLAHVTSSIFQVLFFVTPIMYPVHLLKERGLDFVYRFNPGHYLLDVIRTPILEGGWAASSSYAFCLTYLAVTWLLALAVTIRLDRRVVYLL
ncbi:MAG: ABC transporter permease [Burkholderiales bacterium]|nr:ABC transporter permease [Burkholderiales bacterium]